jgi:hypothetical protein
MRESTTRTWRDWRTCSYRQSMHRGSRPTAHGGPELDADVGEKLVALRSLIPHVEAPVILVAPRRVAKTPRRLRNDGGQAIQRRRHSLSLESPFSVWITAAQGLSAQADEEGRREQGSSPIYPPWTRLGLEGGRPRFTATAASISRGSVKAKRNGLTRGPSQSATWSAKR